MLGAVAALVAGLLGVPVRYEAPAGCPPVEALEAAIAEAGGERAAGDRVLAVRVAEDRRRAEVWLEGADGRVIGRRVVESPDGDCRALVRAVGLSAAVALAPPVAAPVAPRSAWGWAGAAGAGIGLHPGVSLVVEGGPRWRRGRWSVEAGLRASGAPAWVDGAVAGGRVQSGLVALGLRGCGAAGGLEGCAGLHGGVELHGGADFARDARSVGPWLAGSLRVGWRWALGDGAWGPTAELVLPLSRLALTVDGTSAWRTPWAAGIVGVGGGW